MDNIVQVYCVGHVMWTETRPTAVKRFIQLTKNVILLFRTKGHFYHFTFQSKKGKNFRFSFYFLCFLFSINKYLDKFEKASLSFIILHKRDFFVFSISHKDINRFRDVELLIVTNGHILPINGIFKDGPVFHHKNDER